MAKNIDERIKDADAAGVCPECGAKLATEPDGEGVSPTKHSVAHYGGARLDADTAPDAAAIQKYLTKRGRELDDAIDAKREKAEAR